MLTAEDAEDAKEQQWTISVSARLRYLRIAVAAGYVCGIIASPRLWFGLGRTFPRAPVVTGLPAFVSSAESPLSILLLAALALAAASRRPRYYLAAVATLTGLLAMLDQTRLQPWVYQYVLMLMVLACGRQDAGDKSASEPMLAASQLVVGCLYFWSGVQKLNWSFGHEILPGLFESVGLHQHAALDSYLPAFGIGIALCEATVGVALLVRRTRRAAVPLAIGMHVLVLLMLVIAWRNSVVWPWNIGMIAIVMLLFYRCDSAPLRDLASLRRRPRNAREQERNAPRAVVTAPKAVFIICGLAPALSFAGWWDLYLSASLYSGNTPAAVVQISERVRSLLPTQAQRHIFSSRSGELILPFYEWSLADLNVPPYPEPRVFKIAAREVCARAEEPHEVELIVKGRPSISNGSYAVTRADCQQLSERLTRLGSSSQRKQLTGKETVHPPK